MDTAASPTNGRSLPPCISEAFLEMLRSHGVSRAFLFGSLAHGMARAGSDLDLLVTFGSPVHLFQQMDLAAELSRLCGRQVDLTTRIDPIFEPYIQPMLVPLPL